MLSDTFAKAGHLLRQDDAEFGHQAAHAVIGGGAFFDKALPRTVQGEDDLLLFFLDRDKRMVGRPTASQMAAASFLPRLPKRRYPEIIILGDPHNYCKHDFKTGKDLEACRT